MDAKRARCMAMVVRRECGLPARAVGQWVAIPMNGNCIAIFHDERKLLAYAVRRQAVAKAG